MTAILLQDQS